MRRYQNCDLCCRKLNGPTRSCNDWSCMEEAVSEQQIREKSVVAGNQQRSAAACSKKPDLGATSGQSEKFDFPVLRRICFIVTKLGWRSADFVGCWIFFYVSSSFTSTDAEFL